MKRLETLFRNLSGRGLFFFICRVTSIIQLAAVRRRLSAALDVTTHYALLITGAFEDDPDRVISTGYWLHCSALEGPDEDWLRAIEPRGRKGRHL